MRIGIDVDSGERPCEELIKGAVNALKLSTNNSKKIEIVLIGREDKIRSILDSFGKFDNISIINASETIGMDERPVFALRKKKDSTVAVGCRLLKQNQIDAFFSPGNTGATVATSVVYLGMIPHIKKPAMVIAFPRVNGGQTYLLDIGANPEASEDTLVQNAVLGRAYFNIIADKIAEPKIGLLNIGTEDCKGSNKLKKTYQAMRKVVRDGGEFKGNIEGYNIFNGSIDVGVCDGFTGNTILKFAEAITSSFFEIIKNALTDLSVKDKIAIAPMAFFGTKDNIKNTIKGKVVPKFFGAAPLLGVKGIVLIGHGKCSAKDVTNAVELAIFLHEHNYSEKMIELVKKYY